MKSHKQRAEEEGEKHVEEIKLPNKSMESIAKVSFAQGYLKAIEDMEVEKMKTVIKDLRHFNRKFKVEIESQDKLLEQMAEALGKMSIVEELRLMQNDLLSSQGKYCVVDKNYWIEFQENYDRKRKKALTSYENMLKEK